jgi:hypothetical protein
MKGTVIIYDGKKAHEIGLPYFFQDSKIENLNKEQIKHRYKSTLIYLKVLRDMLDNNPDDLVAEAKDPGYLPKVEKGLDILKQMVMDMYGEKEGTSIVNV